MKTREDLKTDYYLQTGEEWLNSQNEPDIDYVQWLEDKILSSLKSMRDEKEEKGEVQLFMDDVHQWADNAFGKERTALAPVYHLKKEVDEVISEMKKGFLGLAIKELADCFILVLNATSKYGYSFDQLFSEAKDKMIINKNRKWGKPDKNGVCEHIESSPQPQPGRGAENLLNLYRKTLDIYRTKGMYYIEDKAEIEGLCKQIFDKEKEYRTQSDKDMYPKWKNPKDEKPESDKLVLLKVTNNKAFMGYYHRYGHWIIVSKDSSYKENDLHQVTEWAYVPEW